MNRRFHLSNLSWEAPKFVLKILLVTLLNPICDILAYCFLPIPSSYPSCHLSTFVFGQNLHLFPIRILCIRFHTQSLLLLLLLCYFCTRHSLCTSFFWLVVITHHWQIQFQTSVDLGPVGHRSLSLSYIVSQ